MKPILTISVLVIKVSCIGNYIKVTVGPVTTSCISLLVMFPDNKSYLTTFRLTATNGQGKRNRSDNYKLFGWKTIEH